MDSITQVALGGVVGYAVLGSKVGRKAALWGAVLGTLPDLDVFLPYAGEVEAFTFHRGFSHSLLMHALISPLLAWLIVRCHYNTRQYAKQWLLLVFLCLSTHAILDSFTVYGTQLMWPLSQYPFAVSNLFIIDPLYTLPLLLGFAAVLIPKVSRPRAASINNIGLVLSSIYIAWSLIAKVYIDHKVHIALANKGISVNAYVSTPAPFSTLLWRIVVMSGDEYYEAYISVFDEAQDLSVSAYRSSPQLLADISEAWGVQRLVWFTKGFYSVQQQKDDIILSDLRMGTQCNYVFNFEVGKVEQEGITLGSFDKLKQSPSFNQLGDIWHRIWEPSVSLAPKIPGKACARKNS